MLIQEIEANALDLAGGEVIKGKLDTHYATLITLNVLDTMMMELSHTGKPFRRGMVTFTIPINSTTGSVSIPLQQFDRRFVRYKIGSNPHWEIMSIAESMDELTRAEDEGHRKMLLAGEASPLTYYLSFKPLDVLTVELWGANALDVVDDLNELPPIPQEFSMVAVYRIADFILNLLLLKNAQEYGSFVMAQKGSIAGEKARVETAWISYRSSMSEYAGRRQQRAFNHLVDENDDWEGAGYPRIVE